MTYDFDVIKKTPLRVYREIGKGEQCVIFGDPSEGGDYCSAAVFSKKFYDCPIVFNQQIDSSQFGYELFYLAKYIYNKTDMWPKLAVERNTGQATIFVLKNLNYPNLFRMVDFASTQSHEGGSIGWVTTGFMRGGEIQGTRRKMLDDFALAIKQSRINLYDREQIEQLQSFIIGKGGRAQIIANRNDDMVMAVSGAYQIHLLTPSEFLDDYDEHAAWEGRQKWRLK